MNTITKSRTSIFDVFKSLFSSQIDVEEVEDIKLPQELTDALKSLESKEKDAEKAINVGDNSSKKGGFAKKINPNTEKAMRAIHKEIKENTNKDKERE